MDYTSLRYITHILPVSAIGHMLDPPTSLMSYEVELTSRTNLYLLHVNSDILIFQREVRLFCITKTGQDRSFFCSYF